MHELSPFFWGSHRVRTTFEQPRRVRLDDRSEQRALQ